MKFTFLSPEDLAVQSIPIPRFVLMQSPWTLNADNTPYLLGKKDKSSRPQSFLEEISKTKFLSDSPLKKGFPKTDDEISIIGDVSYSLKDSSEVIVAETSDFKKAKEMVRVLGYSPARIGEYLQILWCLKDRPDLNYGWHYCYQDRVDGYATLASFQSRTGNIREIIFDTRYDDLSNISGNMESSCYFVK